MGNQIEDCKLGLFQDASFAVDLRDSKSTPGGLLCVFGSHTFVSISWICKKQTAVSHSSAESKIILLDAGLRILGLPALQCWGVCLGQLFSKPAKGTWSVTNVKASFRLIHILAIVYLSQLTMFHPTFPTAHTQPNSTYSKTVRQ